MLTFEHTLSHIYQFEDRGNSDNINLSLINLWGYHVSSANFKIEG